MRERSRGAVPGRAHARHGRHRRPDAARVRGDVGARPEGTHRALDHALHGRGRGAVRSRRDHRPRARAGLRQHRGLEAASAGWAARRAGDPHRRGSQARPRGGRRDPGRVGRAAPRTRHPHAQVPAAARPRARGPAADAGGARGARRGRGDARDHARGRVHRGRRARARRYGARHVSPAYARGLPLELRAAAGRAYVRLVGSVREPSWIIGDAVFPALGMAAFVLLYRAIGAPKAFETVAVIGGILSTYWINVLWGMGAQLYWEKQQGQLALYFAAPCSRMAILAGMAVGGIVMTTVRTVFSIAMGFGVLGVRVHAVSPGLLLAVFVVTMVALYALGMTLSSLFLLYGREAWHLCNAMQEPVYFLSGQYFPIRTLGALG